MKTSVKAILSIVLILGGLNLVQYYYFTEYLPQNRDITQEGTVLQEDVPITIITLMDGNKSDYINKLVTLDGYYIEGGSNISLLITELDIYMNNTLMPDNYLIIGGTVPETLHDLVGSRIYMKGQISWSNETEQLLEISYLKYTVIQKGIAKNFRNVLIEPNFESDLYVEAHVNTKYAVLISGGWKPEKAYSRYWNDISAMYFILTWIYHYDPDNIYIAYKDGIPEDGFAPVHGPATHSYLQSVFSELQGRMGREDDLFIYTTNHGSSSGMALWTPLDNSLLTPMELNAMITNIDYNQEIIVMEQCNSGVFIPTLSKTRRIIITAASATQSSSGADTEGPWDEFVFHFMSAVAKFNINGDPSPVYSDMNNDGKISMYEAFMYASQMDSKPENPYYDDDGDGSGVPALILNLIQPVDEGAFGQNIYL